MIRFGLFLAGFGAGWVARSAVDSSRGAIVTTLAAAMGAVERVQRAIAMEREHLEDLVAEARAVHQAQVARRAAREGAPANEGDLSRGRERAA
jgi:hypothetical protein